jgi:hypothetical protein
VAFRASAVALFLLATMAPAAARAQCTKDIECKGDRVCEAGRCTAPPLPPPPEPTLPPPSPSVPTSASAPASSTEAAVTVEPAVPAPAPAHVTPSATSWGPLSPDRRRTMKMLGGGLMAIGGVSLLTVYVLGQASWSPSSPPTGQLLAVDVSGIIVVFAAGLVSLVAGAIVFDRANAATVSAALPPPAPKSPRPWTVRFAGVGMRETDLRTAMPVLTFDLE